MNVTIKQIYFLNHYMTKKRMRNNKKKINDTLRIYSHHSHCREELISLICKELPLISKEKTKRQVPYKSRQKLRTNS